MLNTSFAHQSRLRRLFRRGDDRLFVAALDHAIADGPVAPENGLYDLIERVSGNGADALVLHKGNIRRLNPDWFVATSLIIHLNASTSLARDPDAKQLVTTVEEAMRLGADAVSMQVNLGSDGECDQLRDLGKIARSCTLWGMPLLAMIYPRGPRIADPGAPDLVLRAATVAAEVGADIVKTPYPGSVAAVASLVHACPIPVLIAGGAYTGDEGAALARVNDVVSAGAAGVAIGRSIFQSPDPAAMTRKVAELVHGHYESSGGIR